MTKITDVDYKKVLFSEVAEDGGLGTEWRKIDDDVRQGTASFTGSDASLTAHKNIHSNTIEVSEVKGDYNFNLECADMSAATRAYFMGGVVETGANGINYKAPKKAQAIYKSVMLIGKNDSVEYATNVKIDAYPTVSDADLHFLKVNSIVQAAIKDGQEDTGSWDKIDSDANDITGFVLVEENAVATIDAVAHTVTIEVVALTVVTALIPIINVSIGANATPNSNEAQDFTTPVTYSVENANGISQDWVVTVTVAI